MRLTFTKLALFGAVALTIAVSNSQSASAQCRTAAAVNIEAQNPTAMNVCATLESTFTTTIIDPSFGDVGVTNKLNEIGCLVMSTAGALNEANTNCTNGTTTIPDMARVVSRLGTGTAGAIAIAGAFPTQEVRIQFQVADNNITCPAGPALKLARLFSDQPTTAATWTWDGDADLSGSNTGAIIGAAPTDADGDLTILIGAEIQNDATDTRYQSGNCEGAFTVTMFY